MDISVKTEQIKKMIVESFLTGKHTNHITTNEDLEKLVNEIMCKYLPQLEYYYEEYERRTSYQYGE
jgi:hypothetical protein